MEHHGHGLTDRGRIRETNQDAFLVDDDLGLYVVCDGLTSSSGGDVAARVAIETCRATIASEPDLLRLLRDGRSGRTEPEARMRLVARALGRASRAVYEMASANPGLEGMACTATLFLVTGSSAVMGHVGDSRLYRLRAGGVEQLSSDHTHVSLELDRGELTPEEARNHPLAHALTRCVGAHASVPADVRLIQLKPGDRYVLCSDGLSRYLESNGELLRILSGHDSMSGPRQLVDFANSRGGSDNITAVAVSIDGSNENAAAAGPLTASADWCESVRANLGLSSHASCVL